MSPALLFLMLPWCSPPQERDGPIDDMNPRALSTPLQITLAGLCA